LHLEKACICASAFCQSVTSSSIRHAHLLDFVVEDSIWITGYPFENRVSAAYKAKMI
jgi:hypothetical protein